MRHAVEIGHSIRGGDFHRDRLAGDECAQPLVQLGPRRVRPNVAGESFERRELDAVRNGDRFALARQQHKEPSRPHSVDAEDARGGWIDAVKVVEQPAVGADLAEEIAQRGKIEILEQCH